MSLILVTPPAQEPVALADLKDHVYIDQTDTSHDSVLTGFLKAARRRAENHCRIAFVTQTWKYSRDGWAGFDTLYAHRGFPQIEIPKPPFQSIVSIQYVDVAGVTQTLADAPTGFQLDPGADTLPARIVPPYAQPWPPVRRIPNNVIITFVAGYGVGAGAKDAQNNAIANAVPDDLQLAIKMTAAHWYENREITAAGGSQALEEIPFGATMILNDYRCLL